MVIKTIATAINALLSFWFKGVRLAILKLGARLFYLGRLSKQKKLQNLEIQKDLMQVIIVNPILWWYLGYWNSLIIPGSNFHNIPWYKLNRVHFPNFLFFSVLELEAEGCCVIVVLAAVRSTDHRVRRSCFFRFLILCNTNIKNYVWVLTFIC